MSDITDYFIGKFKDGLSMESEMPRYFRPRPYRNAAVRLRNCSIDEFEKRRDILVKEAGLNTFLFRADMIPGCDLLSDSGTTTMTIEQWAAMMTGDEAYGSNEGYFELKEQIGRTFGPGWIDDDSRGGSSENLFLFHQGRAAENAFFSVLKDHLRSREQSPASNLSGDLLRELKERVESKIVSMSGEKAAQTGALSIIPSNSHFDTTQGNIENKGMIPLNMPCGEHLAQDESFLFRGNMDVGELENLLANDGARVPLVYLTITNNTGGGQPVSMANIAEIRKITKKYKTPFFFDACRFAENAWFIKKNEKAYSDRSITEIVHEMFSHVDGFHISLKKDGLVNMGGALIVKSKSLFTDRYPDFSEGLTDYQIMAEGHPTYGGLTGRDLKAISEGLRTVVREEYLAARVGQVERFGAQLVKLGIPVIRPIGGHAVYIDVDRFFDMKAVDDDFKGISMAALILIAGHRVCELGLYAFGSYKDGTESPPNPRVNYIRAAVPRLAYEDQDLFSLAEVVRVISENRDMVPGVNIEYGRDLSMRHFKSRFSFK
ncbi:MAG: tryptophanase [Candidatus Krumholzibacteriota bacterium]|nr:tryptophanase [Candidatus Krumholzibacteriota bacterium]